MLWSCLGRFCCTWRAERLYHHMQNQILLLSRSLSTSLQSGTSHRGHNSIQQSLTERAGYWQPFLPCLQHRAPPFTAPAGTSPPSSTVWSAKAPQVFQHRSRHPAGPLCRSAGGVFLHGFGTLYIKSILRLLIIAGAWPPGARGKLCAAATFCCGHPESPATNLTRCGSGPQAGEV